LGESSLHAALKSWYYQPGDLLEVPIDGYIIDIKRCDNLIEFQLRNFNAIKSKLTKLIATHPIRLVHPIAVEKWITRFPQKGDKPLGRRKSPKKGRLEHLFMELVYIPQLAKHPNFSLEILLTQQEEMRRNDGKGSWRRRGWSIIDHKLIKVKESVILSSPKDYRYFVPFNLPEDFTTLELSKVSKIPINLAQRVVYCLRKMDIVEVVGKRGRANLNKIIIQ
jgi:hypothetical protein